MKKQNSYTDSVVRLKDKELLEYVDNFETYQEGAVIAAIWELENRGLANQEAMNLLTRLEAEYSESAQDEESNEITKETQHFEPHIRKDTSASLPKLYTRNVILAFAILFSTFFGSILMAINLNRLKKDKEALYVILFGIVFTYSTSYILGLLNANLLALQILINFAGAYLMDLFFWKKYIGFETPFERQPIRGVILVILIIFMIFLFMVMKNPELVDTILNQSTIQ